jgi:hypothetical protein
MGCFHSKVALELRTVNADEETKMKQTMANASKTVKMIIIG